MIKTATYTLANPTQVNQPIWENLRTLAHKAMITVAMNENHTVHREWSDNALNAVETPIMPDAATIT